MEWLQSRYCRLLLLLLPLARLFWIRYSDQSLIRWWYAVFGALGKFGFGPLPRPSLSTSPPFRSPSVREAFGVFLKIPHCRTRILAHFGWDKMTSIQRFREQKYWTTIISSLSFWNSLWPLSDTDATGYTGKIYMKFPSFKLKNWGPGMDLNDMVITPFCKFKSFRNFSLSYEYFSAGSTWRS